MFCKNCGKNIDDRAAVCPFCGVPTEELAAAKPKEETNILAIIGFALSFVIALAGLICSILGLKKAKELGGKGHSFAVAGLVISIVSMAMCVIIVGYTLLVYFATLDTIFGTLR